MQREIDLTLCSLQQVFRGYIDDISGGTIDNQRLHDLILCTVLFNFQQRGFRFHAGKAQLLADKIRLVGYNVDALGITPSPNEGIFEALKRRDHSNIRAVQKTLGSLQWFSIFVPNFSYSVRSLTRLLKQENRNGHKVNFTEECKKAIEEVERYVMEIPLLIHPNVESKKKIFIAYGNEAFACSIFQMSKENKRELVQFWSRKWTNVVTNYTGLEKVSLAVREIIKQFRSILQGSPEIIFYTSCPTFVELARDQQSWTKRMTKYLAHTISFTPKFLTLPERYQRDLDLLSAPIPIDESQPVPAQPSGIPESFSEISFDKLKKFPLFTLMVAVKQ